MRSKWTVALYIKTSSQNYANPVYLYMMLLFP